MPDENAAAREAARDYAWKWFEYHAGQRMTVFRFFLILTGALTAGCVALFQQRRYGMSALLAILLIIFSFLFWRMDRRNRELVKIGEAHLQFEEEWLSKSLGTETVRLVAISDQRVWPRPSPPEFVRRLTTKVAPFLGTYFLSFGQIYQWMFTVVAVSAFALLLYSLISLLSCTHDSY